MFPVSLVAELAEYIAHAHANVSWEGVATLWCSPFLREGVATPD